MITSDNHDSNLEWWRGASIYQIYPRSFMDANGDGTGDMKGITQKLDHVAALGVDAIWISPFFKSPMDDFGYDVSDYRDVDPCFGTLADFDDMLARAHELGLKVIIDRCIHIHLASTRGSRRVDPVGTTPRPIGTHGWMPSQRAHHPITGSLSLSVLPGLGMRDVSSTTCITF